MALVNILAIAAISLINGSGTKSDQYQNYVSYRLPAAAAGIESRTLEQNRPVAIKVEKILRNDGVNDDKVILAMLVNMWHESRWNANAKLGSCVGLFQLHTKYTGRGMSLKELMNINHHMSRLLSIDCYKDWKKWAMKSSKTTTCGEMAFQFAEDVERCKTRHRAPRRATANQWWSKLKSAN